MKISKLYIALTAFVSLSFLVGCTPSTSKATSAQLPSPPNLDQLDLCQVRDERVANKCKLGQKIVFLPSSWGNEQYSVLFAAANCDLRYSVAMTNGGVSCIYQGAQSVDGKPIDPPPTPKTEVPAKAASDPAPK
jgi:hypothetical protein